MLLLTRLVVFGVLLAAPLVSSARIERVVEKSFAVAATGTVRIDTQGGAIRVTPSTDQMVRITARQSIRANSEAEADELLTKLELTFDQAGSDVTAKAHYERSDRGFHFGSWPPVKVDFIVSLPAGFATDLRTSGGGIEVGDLSGRVEARTSGGGIKLGRLGGSVVARTSGGSITLAEAHGPVDLKTSGGNINVGRVAAGPAELSTSGGGIHVEAVEHGIRAHTSGGSVRVGIVGPMKEDCILSTSGGSVRATVDKGAAFRLDASTSGGGVSAEGIALTLADGRASRSRISGTVNGGGPLLKLRSSGGGIVVRAQ